MFETWRSKIDRYTPCFNRRLVRIAKEPSAAVSQEHEVGVKWKMKHSWRASHWTLGCLWAAESSTMTWTLFVLGNLASTAAKKCVVVLVVKGHGTEPSLLHRQSGLGPVKGLDLALLLHRQDNGVMRRIDIEAQDVTQLGGELRGVGQIEPAQPMRLKAMGAPDALYRTDGDPTGFRHRRAGPLAGRGQRAGQRQGYHPFDDPGGQRRNAGGHGLVAPKPRRTGFPETLLPAPDDGLGLPVARMISPVPRSSAVIRTILSRRTCFCGLFRLATTASRTMRSLGLR